MCCVCGFNVVIAEILNVDVFASVGKDTQTNQAKMSHIWL